MSAAFGFVQNAQSRSPSVFFLLSAPRVEPGRSRGGTGRHSYCLPRFLGCIGVFFSASVTVSSNVPGGRVAEMAMPMPMPMPMTLAEGLLKEGHEHGRRVITLSGVVSDRYLLGARCWLLRQSRFEGANKEEQTDHSTTPVSDSRVGDKPLLHCQPVDDHTGAETAEAHDALPKAEVAFLVGAAQLGRCVRSSGSFHRALLVVFPLCRSQVCAVGSGGWQPSAHFLELGLSFMPFGSRTRLCCRATPQGRCRRFMRET